MSELVAAEAKGEQPEEVLSCSAVLRDSVFSTTCVCESALGWRAEGCTAPNSTATLELRTRLVLCSAGWALMT